MKPLKVNLDEIQKAMEDIDRDAFEYFLDKETGDVIILSEDIISKADSMLSDIYEDDMTDYDEMEFDADLTMPDWIEEEVELAIDIFVRQQERYERIPERRSNDGYKAMQEFAETVDEPKLREELLMILDGTGAFRRFKDALDAHPKERKRWYTLNARRSHASIIKWLDDIGIMIFREGDPDAAPDESEL